MTVPEVGFYDIMWKIWQLAGRHGTGAVAESLYLYPQAPDRES